MNKSKTIVAVVAVAAVLLAAVVWAAPMVNLKSQAAPTNTILENAEEDGNFTQLIDALNATGLADTLNGSGPFTVFAPTNDAFDAANNTLEGMDKANLTDVLQYHVVSGEIMSDQLVSGMTLTTLQGEALTVIVNETGAYVNDAKVVSADIDSSNGIIHAVDKVLMPMTIMEVIENQSDLSSLNDALDRANLTDALNGTGPFTVFAPNNDAFDAASDTVKKLSEANDTTNLTNLLTYHVVPGRIVLNESTENQTLTTLQGERLVIKNNGSGLSVNNVPIDQANLVATNGVVHVIGEVLETPKTIAQMVMADDRLNSLEAALNASDLMETLNGTGQFTLFAPNDAAFENLDPALVDWLMNNDTSTLAKILQYHLVTGEVFSWQLQNSTVTTVEGSALNVTVEVNDNQTKIMVGNATVIVTDIVATNGVIHIIDAVLLPPSLNETTPTTPSTGQTPQPTCP